jgi:hypothetical protein
VATEKQKTANRQNAKLSSGPVSEAGKEAVSQNATTHGLTGHFILLTEQEYASFVNLLERMLEELRPTTFHETELIERMAESLWRSQKAVTLQDMTVNELAFETDPVLIAEQSRKLDLFLRYQAGHDRAYQRYAAELRKLQSERKKEEIGFVSQKHKQERHEGAMALNKARVEHQNLRNSKLALELKPSDSPSQPRRHSNPEPKTELLAA